MEPLLPEFRLNSSQVSSLAQLRPPVLLLGQRGGDHSLHLHLTGGGVVLQQDTLQLLLVNLRSRDRREEEEESLISRKKQMMKG